VTNMVDAWQRIVEFIRASHCSDVFLSRCSVTGRVDGRIVRLSAADDFTEEEFDSLIRALFKDRADLLQALDQPMPSLDFSTEMQGMRFRVNVGRAQRKLAVALRPLPEIPPNPEELGIPEKVIKAVTEAPKGLVLLTGSTGSGKTTTLASFLQKINRSREVKIITIEDPIEFIFRNEFADITQREVVVDCASFHSGARDAMRQNPDVIAIGEIRDQETAVVGLQAAETGHLVFATLHANNVQETPERLLKLLPAEMRDRARDVLSSVVVAILSQVLLPRRDGGRIALREILLHDETIKSVLKNGKDHELEHYMRSGRLVGMVDRKTHLKSIRSKVEPREYERWAEALD
jgi:twitching motility protein PilT